MSELVVIPKAFRTIEEAFDANGQLTTGDIPQEGLAFLGTLVSKDPQAEYLGDIKSPYPIPDFLKALEVRANGVLRYSDNVYIRLPERVEPVGDIPEVEYSDDPLLDTGPLSNRRYKVLADEMDILFGSPQDVTRGFDYKYEMRVPQSVKDDPYGADFTTGATVISDE